MGTIKIQSNNGPVKLNESEVNKIYNDSRIMQHCILAIINPEVAQCSDIYIDSGEARMWLQNYFLRSDYWSEKFINEIFENKITI